MSPQLLCPRPRGQQTISDTENRTVHARIINTVPGVPTLLFAVCFLPLPEPGPITSCGSNTSTHITKDLAGSGWVPFQRQLQRHLPTHQTSTSEHMPLTSFQAIGEKKQGQNSVRARQIGHGGSHYHKSWLEDSNAQSDCGHTKLLSETKLARINCSGIMWQFSTGLVHRKIPQQVSRIHRFPPILPKFFMTCGGLLWDANPNGKLTASLKSQKLQSFLFTGTVSQALPACCSRIFSHELRSPPGKSRAARTRLPNDMQTMKMWLTAPLWRRCRVWGLRKFSA